MSTVQKTPTRYNTVNVFKRCYLTNQSSDDDASGVIAEPNADGTYQVFKVRFSKPMPRALRGRASDAAINLRNALDQAICSVFAFSGIPKHTTYFPIARDLTDQHYSSESMLTLIW